MSKLDYSEEKLLDAVDYLSGRFIIIYHYGQTTKFMNDAFGTRSAFYSFQSQVIIASHCRIIGDYLQLSQSKLMEAIISDKKWETGVDGYYPGNLTPYKGTYVLTPNTLINIEEKKIQRFYPRSELLQVQLSDAIDELSVMFKRQLELLHNKFKLAISLSAGIDSRVTLAAAREIVKDVTFFTYVNPQHLNVDRRAAWFRNSIETDKLTSIEIANNLE